MLIVEPTAIWQERQARREAETAAILQAPLVDPDGWEAWIISHLASRKGQPILIWRLINAVAAGMRPYGRARRAEVRLAVWRSLRLLIRSGKVKRVRRRYVQVGA